MDPFKERKLVGATQYIINPARILDILDQP